MSYFLFHQDDDDALDRCPMCGARLRTFASPGVISEECPQCPFKVDRVVDDVPYDDLEARSLKARAVHDKQGL